MRFILVGVLLVAAIIAATVAIVEMQRLEAIDDYQTAMRNLGNGMARQTTQALASVASGLADVRGEVLQAGVAGPAGVQAAMRAHRLHDILVERAKSLGALDSIALVDAGGTRVDDSRAAHFASADFSGRDFFRHYLATGDRAVYVGAPTVDPESSRWTVPMVVPVDDARGRFCGLVVGQISVQALLEFYRVAMPAHRSVSLARSDGLILLHYPGRDEEVGRWIPESSAWYARIAQGGGIYLGPQYFEAPVVMASVHPLNGLPLAVEASVLLGDVLARWEARRPWIALGGVLSAAAVLALLRAFARQYGRLEHSERSLAAKNAELDLTRWELEETLGNLSQGVCLFDEDRRLLVFNPRYCDLYDMPPDTIRTSMTAEEVTGLCAAVGRFPPGAVDGHLARLHEAIEACEPYETVIELTDGRSISYRCQPLPDRRWVSTDEDITQRRAAEARVLFLARHDALTGLANRAAFHEALQLALAAVERGLGLAVLCLDLDRFKFVNDTYGHPAGDSLLCAVAQRLAAQVRAGDVVARLGGDEFAILLHEVAGPEQAAAVARRVIESIHAPFELEGVPLGIGVSIGVAVASDGDPDPIQIMKNADVALYRAKREGRETWRFFEQGMDAAAQARGELEADLRRALARGELEVHYQPLVACRDRCLRGFEALLRWRHPVHGTIPPAEFIPLAEDIGIITDIGAWVLREACAQARTWPGHVRVAVNLSARQFRDPHLVETVAQALGAAGIEPRRVELEITESVPLLRDERTLATLYELHRIGVGIVLDDFGTGYSSLSYLRGFPFHSIKIDRSFVSDLQVRGEGRALVNGIIGLARNLGMDVTAEGVETEEQFALLAQAGCTEIQGYLISAAVPSGHCARLIERLAAASPFAREPEAKRLRLLLATEVKPD
jgi:diguanylate cyclase (GGDEF)-like protein